MVDNHLKQTASHKQRLKKQIRPEATGSGSPFTTDQLPITSGLFYYLSTLDKT